MTYENFYMAYEIQLAARHHQVWNCGERRCWSPSLQTYSRFSQCLSKFEMRFWCSLAYTLFQNRGRYQRRERGISQIRAVTIFPKVTVAEVAMRAMKEWKWGADASYPHKRIHCGRSSGNPTKYIVQRRKATSRDVPYYNELDHRVRVEGWCDQNTD